MEFLGVKGSTMSVAVVLESRRDPGSSALVVTTLRRTTVAGEESVEILATDAYLP
jgi:hypothetical protein